MSLDFRFDMGKGAKRIDGRATREGGYVHCPNCGHPGLYYASVTSTQVCVECKREYLNREILKPVVVVRR